MITFLIIGTIISFFVISFVNVKYNLKFDSDVILMLLIIWPILLFIALPIWLFDKGFKKLFELTTNLIEKVVK
jgi:hypothetical protein